MRIGATPAQGKRAGVALRLHRMGETMTADLESCPYGHDPRSGEAR